MNLNIITLLFIVTLFLSVFVVANSSDLEIVVSNLSEYSSKILERKDSCRIETYVEEIPNYVECSYIATECSSNTTCYNISLPRYCVNSFTTVEHSEEICDTTGYNVGDYSFITEGYECSVEDINADSSIIICDSVNDGNGDGICTSGESCIKYIVDSDGIKTYEKNSRDEFLESDESYYLDKVAVERVKE